MCLGALWHGASCRWVWLMLALAGHSACGATEDLPLAPVITSGSIGVRSVFRKQPDGDSETTQQVNHTLNADTYIWQPWLARVGGRVSVAQDFTSGRTNSTSTLASGEVTLSALPLSRYPATLSLSHTDSRVDGEFVGADYTRDRINLTAGAAVRDDIRLRLRTSYDQTLQPEVGDRLRSQIGLSAEKRFSKDDTFAGISSIILDTEYSDQQFDNVDDDDISNQLALARLRIRAEPADRLNFDSATTVLVDDEQFGDETLARTRAEEIATAQWRPDDAPYTVTTVFRALLEELDYGGSSTTQADTSESLVALTSALNWPVNENLSVTTGIRSEYESIERRQGSAAGDLVNPEGKSYSAGALGGASYNSDRHKVAGFDWRWNANGLVDTGFDSAAGFENQNNAGLGHRVERPIDIPFIGAGIFSADQRLSAFFDTGDDATMSAAHGVAATHTSAGNGQSTFMRLFARDNRDIAGGDHEFQLIGFQLTRREALDQRSQWFGNLSAQLTRQGSEGETLFTANGTLGYREFDVFAFENLIFDTELRLNDVGLQNLFLTSDEDSRRELSQADWRNRLSYRIGRLTLGAEASAFRREEGIGITLLFSGRREFTGSFFQ